MATDRPRDTRGAPAAPSESSLVPSYLIKRRDASRKRGLRYQLASLWQFQIAYQARTFETADNSSATLEYRAVRAASLVRCAV